MSGAWLQAACGYDDGNTPVSEDAHAYWWQLDAGAEIRRYHDETFYRITTEEINPKRADDDLIFPTLDAAKLAYMLIYGGTT